jgi:hypothetical protein
MLCRYSLSAAIVVVTFDTLSEFAALHDASDDGEVEQESNPYQLVQ